MDALKRAGARVVTPKRQDLPAPEKKTMSRPADAMDARNPGAISKLLGQAIAKLMPRPFEPLVGPPAGKPIKATGSLIGPGAELLDPCASYAQNLAGLKSRGVPRFPWLTPIERKHETAFANDVEAHLEHFVEGAELLANDEELGTMVFEPDGVKRLYGPYGTGDQPGTPEERAVRAEGNHALHPTATLVARLAFLKRLDALAKLPDGDPKRSIFATAGGCAAGKGDMDETVKRQLGGFPFGAMWDSAGESDSLENAWVLQAAQARGLKVVFAFAANEPAEQYSRVLDRGERTGRFVDVVTFAHSYVEGTKNMKAFLRSPAYLAAKQAGAASTLGMHMGPYDKRAETNPRLAHYPEAKLLRDDGLVDAADLPDPGDTAALVASALGTLEVEAARLRKAGGDADGLLLAALGNAEKLARAGLLERA